MKKILIMLGLAMFFSPMLSSEAMAVTQKNMGYISVNVSESMEVVPNIATVNFSVETTDIDSKKATELNSQVTAKIIDALKQELASDKKSFVQTKNFSLRPNYKKDTENETMVIKNYTAVNTIQVKTSDIAKVSTLIDIAIKNNATNVNGVTMSLDENDTYLQELANKALLKAKNSASNTAAALNQKIAGVKNVRINSYQQTSNGVRLYKSMAMDAAGSVETAASSTPIEAGKIKLNVSVDAEFYVK